MSIQSFFNKVSANTLNELVDFLFHNQSEITIKVDGGPYIKTKVLTRNDTNKISVSKINNQQYSNSAITGLFQIQNERYFFYSHLTSTNSSWVLNVPNEIFHMQRRNDYRVALPLGLIYKCEIVYVNARKTKIATEIRDMSLGGCLLSVQGKMSDQNIKIADEIDLYLKLGKFEFTKMPLILKHIKYIEDKNYSLLGVSFHEPTSDILAELQSMLLYLDRIHRGKDEY